MIKKFLFAALTLAFVTSCNNQKSESSNASAEEITSATEEMVATDAGVIEFEETEYNFGTVKEGEVVERVFKFKNTGKAPVILAQVSASCGCTTPDFTKEPILPGKDGEIKVSFNSQGQVGAQQKIVTVSSNAENNITTVQIRGTVEK